MKYKKIVSTFVVMAMVIAAFGVLTINEKNIAKATTVTVDKDGSGYQYNNLTCGEIITVEVKDNSLTDGTDYNVKVWTGSSWVTLTEVGADEADSHGDLSLQVRVPGWDELGMNPIVNGTTGVTNNTWTNGTAGMWNISLFDGSTQIMDDDGEPVNITITIGNLYDIRFKYDTDGDGDLETLEHIIYNKSYYMFYIYIYNWTGSTWELETSTFNVSIFDPEADLLDYNSAITTGYWDWDFVRSQNNYGSGSGNLENYYWVNASIDSTHYSNISLPVKLDVTCDVTSDLEWGDEVQVTGYVYDGQGDGVPEYDMRVYAPVNGGYEVVESTFDTYPSGRYSFSADTADYSAGTWHVGTYRTGTTYRIDETDTLDISNFISYHSFEVATKDSLTVRVVNTEDIISGFDQTINVSVYNETWLDDEWKDLTGENEKLYFHITGLKGYNATNNQEYEDDDIVPISATFTKETEDQYAYFELDDYRFNETGTATLLVSYPGNQTDYAYNDSFYSDTYDNEDLLANFTGSATFSVVSPGNINMIIDGTMVESVPVTNPSGDLYVNDSSGATFTVNIYGSSQDDPMNATLHVEGCGLDFTIDEDDTEAGNEYLTAKSTGQYTVKISPKTGGTLTITATNGTYSTSNDYTISGLGGSVTTSSGDDLEISVTQQETITLTVTNGQYAEVFVTFYDENWENGESINDTTGDGATEGNGLNGIYEIIPSETDISEIGYLVVVAKVPGPYYMYDIIEIAPIHDIVIEITDPAEEQNQTLTAGLDVDEQTFEFKIYDPDGNVIEDIDEVTGKLIDEDHDENDPLQEITFTESTGNVWTFDSSETCIWFDGNLVITAVNRSGEDEHDGNITIPVGYADVTFTPSATTAAIGEVNLTVEISAVDALGNALPENTRLYLNVEDATGLTLDDTYVDLDENGEGEFDITTVGNNEGAINCTFQAAYAAHGGNMTTGEFTISFPNFEIDPDTISTQATSVPVTVTVTDNQGEPIPNVNLTFTPQVNCIIQPDPVQTDSDGVAAFEGIQPQSSGTANVTICQNLVKAAGNWSWTSVQTDSYLTVTRRTLEITPSTSMVYEDSTLTLTVIDQASNPVSGATVKFAGNTKQTESDGTVTFSADQVPDIDIENSEYTVYADKSGYPTATATVKVLNRYTIQIVPPNQDPEAGEEFDVTIVAKGAGLAGATVTFEGDEYTSGALGKVTLTAPDTPDDYTVSASYGQYTPGSTEITVVEAGDDDEDDGEDTPGFELLTLIAALGVAFILLRRRRNH